MFPASCSRTPSAWSGHITIELIDGAHTSGTLCLSISSNKVGTFYFSWSATPLGSVHTISGSSLSSSIWTSPVAAKVAAFGGWVLLPVLELLHWGWKETFWTHKTHIFWCTIHMLWSSDEISMYRPSSSANEVTPLFLIGFNDELIYSSGKWWALRASICRNTRENLLAEHSIP